jgi:nitroimidazol reductase NimA-like FMN-containing flavoprotein (pyridoxamine 5'-phosphate oxidase superfamily)
MRRKDREVTDPEQIRQIILDCPCCRVGFYDEGDIYIVPMNFGYVENGEQKTFYFHGAAEGRKASLIQNSPHVGFELDANYSLIKGENACGYSAHFQSVIGTGRIQRVERLEEKKAGLLALMQHYTDSPDWTFSTSSLQSVEIFRLDVETLSCKAHLNFA